MATSFFTAFGIKNEIEHGIIIGVDIFQKKII